MRKIPEFPKYMMTDKGYIFNQKTGDAIAVKRNGYITLYGDLGPVQINAGRLVMGVIKGERRPDIQLRYKDGDVTNVDPNNLEWMEIHNEDARPVPGYPLYVIHKDGYVMNIKRGNRITVQPYGFMSLYSGEKSVSVNAARIMLEVFGDGPHEYQEIHFKDGDIRNIAFDNLEWKEQTIGVCGKCGSIFRIQPDAIPYEKRFKNLCWSCDSRIVED